MRYRSEQDEQDFSYEKEEGPMIASKKEDDSDVDEYSGAHRVGYRSEQDLSYEEGEGSMMTSNREDDSDVDECSVGISISQPESIGLS